jgi:predicted MPP superfamily phosphohydrolase
MPIIGLFLSLATVIGNAAVLVYSLNWWYGNPFPHRLLSVMRIVHGVLMVALPVEFWWRHGWDVTAALVFDWEFPGQMFVGGYVLACLVVALVVLPVITIRRMRHTSRALIENHTQTIDMTARIGYKPVGRGKYRLLARLPGNQIFQVDFAEKTLYLRDLPAAWDGLTILHLTDLHLCGTPDREFFREVIAVCRDWEPDLLALTGDVVDSAKHHRWILPLLGRLRWRSAGLAILGNHDTWFDPGLVRRRLRRLGMDVLSNGWKQLDIRGQPMVVIGNERPWNRSATDMASLPDGVFRLCLSHTPDNMPWAKQHRISLMLAGHNHGGQIRFPIIGSVLVPSRFSRRYDCGTFQEGATVLHVCRGLAGQHPLRYNCNPEVARLTLKRMRDEG